MSKSHTFDNGIPSNDGMPELLDEYLDRVETLGVQHNEEVIKKQGPLALRLYIALRGEAYVAAKAANIAKAELAKLAGVSVLVAALRCTIRGSGPTQVCESFDKYFDGGARRPGMSISTWLTQWSEVQNQLTTSDTTTKINDNVEAYFLLNLSGLSKPQRSQVLASCARVCEPALMGEAMRVQICRLAQVRGPVRGGPVRGVRVPWQRASMLRLLGRLGL
jgi:hypothetical protein